MKLAVIFDMDGVLIDSQPLHYEIDMAVLNACGYPAQLATVTPYTGVSNPDRWPKYKSTLGLTQTVDTLIEMQTNTMLEVFQKADLTAIKGIPELLKWIKEKGLSCAVASSSSHELINLVLESVNIREYFDILISGEDVAIGKPAPDIYLRAAEVLGFSPEQCIAIEDATTGILAAKNAGLTCIAYRNPNTHGQDVTLADYAIDHYEESFSIITVLGGLL